MAAALRHARRNEGLTGINPCVGCLVVRDGVIVGRGVTGPADITPGQIEAARVAGRAPVRGGWPHAERAALDDAGLEARGATAYVTLEPCAHHGNTPPCADALIAAGIDRVVVGVGDPDPRVAGRGIARLRDAGVSIMVGVLKRDCEQALAPFLSRSERGRPHVLLKIAVSPDGFIGRAREGNVAITGPRARAQTHLMRARADMIVVGASTAVLDRPRLDVRLPGMEHRSPIGMVLDRSGAYAHVIGRAGERPRLAASRSRTPAEFLTAAFERDVGMVMVEGGATLARAFLEADLVDEIALFVGSRPIGGDVVSPVPPDEVPPRFALVREDRFGEDRLLSYWRA